ncbi:MAG: hypothetical protein HY287_03005 [Planctomycetes bacterium]|nr:hypothetical protein [Planctomycetota bacterium]
MVHKRIPIERNDRDSCVHRTIGTFDVTLRSELRQVLHDFASIYPPPPPDSALQKHLINIEVIRAGRSRIGRRLYQVRADGEEVGGRHPWNEIFPLVEWGINLRIIAKGSEFLQFHAASMAFQDNGVIFAGDSGSGKSTLAAVLLARGWQYYCDEFALVDRSTLGLHPFPKALCIKSGSYPVMRSLGVPFARRRDFIKQAKGRVGYVNPRDVRSDSVAGPTPIRFVIFPAYAGESIPKLLPISRAEAAMRLFRCCFNRHAVGDDTLPIIQKLISHASCFCLDVGEARATGSLLEATINESRPERVPHAAAPEKMSTGLHFDRQHAPHLKSRREVLRIGAKLAYVAPCVLTLSAHQVFAATSNPSGICSTASHTGQLCNTDTDCCTRQCNLGVCK